MVKVKGFSKGQGREIKIGFYDEIRINLQSLLKDGKVEVLMADGRVGIAQYAGRHDAFWVNFGGDGKEVLWSRIEEEVSEILGLICDKCKKSFRVRRFFIGWCDGCHEALKARKGS